MAESFFNPAKLDDGLNASASVIYHAPDSIPKVQWPFAMSAAFDDLNASAANATSSFEKFRDAFNLPHVSEWLALAQIGRTIMTVRLDTGRLMTTRPRWVYQVPTRQGELVGEWSAITRGGRVVGVVISDDRGNLLFASDEIGATLVPGEDLTIALPIGIT